MTERHDEKVEGVQADAAQNGARDLYNPYAPGGSSGPGGAGGPDGAGGGPEGESVWDLMLGVFTSPAASMCKIAAQRPVGTAALLVIGLTLFSVVMGAFSAQTGMPDLGELPPGVPPEFLEAMSAMLPRVAVFASVVGAVGGILWWFVRAAVYGLLGELMGSRSDGRAMLATLGFASLPMLLQTPINFMLTRLGLTWLANLVGIGFWVWSVILSVLAIRAALRSETGRCRGDLHHPGCSRDRPGHHGGHHLCGEPCQHGGHDADALGAKRACTPHSAGSLRLGARGACRRKD